MADTCSATSWQAKPLMAVAFYTRNTPYEEEAAHLAGSLRQVGLPYHLESIEPRGTWRENVQFKPWFIREMLIRFGGIFRILYVDVDARFHRYPSMLSGMACDFAAHYYKGHQLAGGTLYFEQNDRARRLIRRWLGRMQEDPRRPLAEQISLQETAEELHREGRLHMVRLPEQYLWISHTRAQPDGAVIEHATASTQYAEAVGGRDGN